MFKWEVGRQNNSYKKLTLIKFKYFDCHLIKLKKFAKIPFHTDKVDGYKHYRINFLIKGHYIQCYKDLPNCMNKFFTLFRSDINDHMCGTNDTEAVIFSIGWLIKEKKC